MYCDRVLRENNIKVSKKKKLKMFRTFSFISFICALEISSCYEAKDEGSTCQQLGLSGICRRATDCEIAINAIRRGNQHDLLRCGFIDAEEVVCCPDLSNRNPVIETSTADDLIIWTGNEAECDKKNDKKTTNSNRGRIKTKRKCEIMCEKMYKDNNIKPEIEFHVLNGEDAQVGQFPHMAALGYRGEDDDDIDWKRCGASLISSRFLITAAHCLVCIDCADNPPIKARFGATDLRDEYSAQDVDIKNLIPHSDYNYDSKHNDIALVELMSDVRTTKTVYPACLYTEADDPQGMRVTGWGQTDGANLTSVSNILQFATIEAVSIDECNSTIVRRNRNSAKVIVNSQICAISKSDACGGDSGGPLQVQKKQGGYDIVGIVSYGLGCGTTVPGIYTRVSAYLDWIEEKVWPT